jgi:hypothetical protein
LFKLTNPSKEQREEIANLRDEELVKRLYQVQLEKKCLVILDDIWTIPTWNNLCPAFPYWKTAGSKILLTTRKMDVALHPDPTCFLHVPPQLNDDESWELLKKKACVDNNYPGNVFATRTTPLSDNFLVFVCLETEHMKEERKP